MGSSDMEARCKKHPSHRRSKGVCPSCLRERLAHLSAASSSTTTTNDSESSRTTSVYLSDSDNNSNRHSPGRAGNASPPPAARVNRLKMSALLRARPEEPLTKSRSLAFVITADEGEQIGGTGKGGDAPAVAAPTKTKGFWARLIPGKASRRRIDGASAAADIGVGLHSKTVRETASARWVL